MISIFLPSVRRPSALNDALDALAEQTYKNFEVLAVYDFSDVETADVVARYKNHMLIRELHSTGSLVEAANQALGEARGEIFIRTDDDALATKNWLQAVYETFEEDSRIGGVTGPTTIPLANLEGRDLTKLNALFKSGSLAWRMIGKFYLGYVMENRADDVSQWLQSGAFTLGSNYPAAKSLPRAFDCTNIEACNFSVRTDLLRGVGGFDPLYKGVGDYHEPDASLKIKKLGYRLVFEPRAAIEHRPSVLGIYKARANAYARSQNFLLFYFRHIKPENLNGWVRFSCYLAMMNLYWCWKAIVAMDVRQLGGVVGTATGVIKYFPELLEGRSIFSRK